MNGREWNCLFRVWSIYVSLLLITAFLPSLSQADIYYWDAGGDGALWSDDDNWDLDSVPGPGDDVYVELDGAVITYDYNYDSSTPLAYLCVDYGATLKQGSNTLIASVTQIGYFGASTYNLSGGTHSTEWLEIGSYNGSSGTYTNSGGSTVVSSDLTLGYYSGGNGVYELSNTGSVSAMDEYIGFGGNGTFNQNGGTNTVGNNLVLGDAAGSSGTYALDDGILDVLGNEHIGTLDGAVGEFHQYGGVHTVEHDLYLGDYAGSTGRYFLDNGSLTVNGAEFIGHEGVGEFTQTGGIHTVDNDEWPDDLWIGYATGSEGTYYLSNEGVLNAGTIIIGGYGGNGHFVQDGEDTEITTGWFYVGANQDESGNFSTGDYTLCDGSLSTELEFIGEYGTGTFAQYSGNHSVATDLNLAYFAGSNGTYDLYGGELFAGWIHIGSAGEGVFNQNGGTNTINGGFGALILGHTSTGIGTYNLDDGILDVTFEEYIGDEGKGCFYQNGGEHNLDGAMYVGLDSGGTGEYHLSNGTLNVSDHITLGTNTGSSGTFELSGTGSVGVSYMHVGRGGAGTFTQTGGTNTVAGDVTIAADAGSDNYAGSGTYALQGGTLNAAAVINNDTFEYSGGDCNANLVNNVNATTTLSGTGTRTINGDVVNNGTFSVHETTAVYTGTFTNNGAYISDPSIQTFTDLVIGDSGYLVGGDGDQFLINGNFVSYSDMNTQWDTGLAEISFAAGTLVHEFHVTGLDMGADMAGYTDNFAWQTLSIEGSYIQLFDENAEGGALYVGTVLGVDLYDVDSDGDLDAQNITGNGLDIYYNPLLAGNEYLGGLTYALLNGGSLTPVSSAVPAPAAMLLMGSGLICLVAVRRRRM
ncbi:MAG TPA: PEP-CTERM sorting domain-containing protein [Thermodesulfobacteriota bacterium]|nr:PEP-CTERM sorting domain-containing protein [Thermodesulfobacteriota bacterium]HNU71320.1 PEP-CTERM sorting domain-containing protein [Thermodesulfobacteriota bacterium]